MIPALPFAGVSAPAAGPTLACPTLHAAPGPLPPHWAVLVVATAALGAAIAVGVALADRLLDRLVG